MSLIFPQLSLFNLSTWCFVLFTLFTVYLYNFIQQVRRLPPGPFPLPFIGNVHQIVFRRKLLFEILVEWGHKYGNPFTIWIAHRPMVMANSKEAFHEVAGPLRNLLGGRMRLNSSDLVTRGNLDVVFSDFSSGWAVLRRLVQVAIRQYSKSDKFAVLVAEQTDLKIEEIFHDADETEIEVVSFFEDPINNVVAISTFGKSFQKGDESYEAMVKALRLFEDNITECLPSDMHPLLGWLLFWIERRMIKGVHVLFKVVDMMFKHARDSWTPGSTRHFTDFLLNAREQFEAEDRLSAKFLIDKNLSQATLDIFLAGVSTSRGMLGHCALRLANDEEVQEELRQEVLSEIGSEICLNSDRIKLPKVNSFLEEVLRFHSIAPLNIPRTALDDVVFNGRHVPKGSTVIMNLFALNRDPSIWGEDANEFKPMRFLHTPKEQTAKGVNTFGVGVRSCPGEKLARADIFYIIVRMLQKLRLSCPNGPGTANLQSPKSHVKIDPRRQPIVFSRI